ATWISQGFYTHSIPFDELKNLKDGSQLKVEFKAGLSGSQDEGEAQPFQVRTYTVKTRSPTSGHESFPDTVTFGLFNKGDAYTSQSGLEFVLLASSNDMIYGGASANSNDYSKSVLLLTTSVKVNITNGHAKTIEFFYASNTTGENTIAAKIDIYDLSGQQIESKNLLAPTMEFHQYGYTAQEEKAISYFEISNIQAGFTRIRDIKWG
ncbi:MAG: hypothetical protein ABWZ65_21290, partial [Pseudomonas mandelii]